ncbi:MAG: DCC1-like thiol-disulfide oxidoreductase family protein [Saprospiraceae bacterium]
MDIDGKGIVFYDGECILCSKWIYFLSKADKKKKLLFASLDRFPELTKGFELIKDVDLPDSIYYFKNNQLYYYSKAILKILMDLGGFWKIFSILYLIPKVLRDSIYKWIARQRYSIFGKRTSCSIPDEFEKSRFL